MCIYMQYMNIFIRTPLPSPFVNFRARSPAPTPDYLRDRSCSPHPGGPGHVTNDGHMTTSHTMHLSISFRKSPPSQNRRLVIYYH